MSAAITAAVDDSIAVLTFDDPGRGANVFCQSVLDELEGWLDEFESRSGLEGLVIRSGKPGIFIAGADLREFAASLDISDAEAEAICRRGQQLFMRLARFRCVTVAAIDGVCLGGGAELAAWCDRRVITTNPRAQIGWPEVKLGLIPGWGGTVRAARLAGLGNAVELITSGRAVSGPEAVRYGLCDVCVAPERLEEAVRVLVREESNTRAFEADRQRWRGPIGWNETELGFLGLTAHAMIQRETKGQYPAPEVALEVLLEGSLLDEEQAAEREAQAMAGLFGSPVNRALLNVFFLTDRNKKDRGIATADLEPARIARVGVVGAGIMGSGIAAANARRGMTVWLADASDEALAKGIAGALEEAAYDRDAGKPTAERLREIALRLHPVAAPADYGRCDLVIEAVVENENVKAEVLPAVEKELPDGAILASNTSTIPITRLASHLARPDRFLGIHFFNPVRRMQLVEVIRGEATSDHAVASAVAYAKRLGKMPVVVRDAPGFLVNRLLLPYMAEAIELLQEGVPMDRIERLAKAFGMPMGPFTLYDVVGLDTALFAGTVLWKAFPDRIPNPPLLVQLVKAGRLGQKSGAGFFRYAPGRKKGEVDPELETYLKPHRREGPEMDDAHITDRLFLPMLAEATRVLEEGLVRDPRDVDLAMIFGVGFPAFRGGLLFWGDTLGAAHVLERLGKLDYLGPRAEPTALLREFARSGRRFYDWKPPDA